MIESRQQQGMSLIELMVVVAIVGVLATVAVVTFSKSASRSKIEAEVAAVFGEFHVKQGQYQMENGTYLPVGQAGSNLETDPWPVVPSGTDTTHPVAPLPASWAALHYTGNSGLYCAYVVITGAANDATTIGPKAAAFGFTAPGVDWYYVLAECDADNDPATNSFYISFSNQQAIIKTDPGK